MAIPYFPMYAADWLSDPNVSALTYEEQGVFFHLMCRMWQTSECRLLDDDVKISRMLKMSHLKWKKLKEGLSEVLTFENGTFFSKRLLIEYQFAEKTSGVNSKAAKKRWEVKSAKVLINKEIDDADAERTECHKIRLDKIRLDKKEELKSKALVEPVKPARPAHKKTDEEWMEEIKANPAYQGLDFDVEVGKAQAWCMTKGRKCSRAFLLNWFNRAEKNITLPGVQTRPKSYREQVNDAACDAFLRGDY